METEADLKILSVKQQYSFGGMQVEYNLSVTLEKGAGWSDDHALS